MRIVRSDWRAELICSEAWAGSVSRWIRSACCGLELISIALDKPHTRCIDTPSFTIETSGFFVDASRNRVIVAAAREKKEKKRQLREFCELSNLPLTRNVGSQFDASSRTLP